MSGAGFGVWGGRGVCCVAVLSFATVASAQSTASFPDPNGAAQKPAAPRPTTPVAAPPAPVPAAAAPASASPTDSTTDSRYPVLHNPIQVSAPPIAGSGLTFNPALLPYRVGLPVPAGYRVEHRSANGLIGGGLALFAVSYIAALALGAGDGFSDGTGWTVVPVIGPWAAIGARSYHCSNDTLQVTSAVSAANKCVNGAFNQVQTIAILSADAVIQATGAVLFFAGLASGEDELVRSDLETGLRVTPRAVGSTGFGVGFDGRF